MSDVRYAIRALAKNPAFSLTVIAVLTLGIGLNAAVFTMLKSMALSPLAGVDGSARLAVDLRARRAPDATSRVSYPDYQYLRDHDRAFSGLFGSSLVDGQPRPGPQRPRRLGRARHRQLLSGARRPRRSCGRTLLPSDEIAPGRHPVVVLSDGLWRRDFGADPDIVGKTVEINNYPLTVVGVADPTFHGTIVSLRRRGLHPGDDGAAARLHVRQPADDAVGASSPTAAPAFFYPQGYLRPGTTLASAAAQTDALWADAVARSAADRCRAAAEGRAVLAVRRTARRRYCCRR